MQILPNPDLNSAAQKLLSSGLTSYPPDGKVHSSLPTEEEVSTFLEEVQDKTHTFSLPFSPHFSLVEPEDRLSLIYRQEMSSLLESISHQPSLPCHILPCGSLPHETPCLIQQTGLLPACLPMAPCGHSHSSPPKARESCVIGLAHFSGSPVRLRASLRQEPPGLS